LTVVACGRTLRPSVKSYHEFLREKTLQYMFSFHSANCQLAGLSRSTTSHRLELQAIGYHVIVSKEGAGPLDQCTVSSVRPGPVFSRTDSGVPGSREDLVTTVTSKTVYVDVTC
jgi:hypothetical protein